MFTEYDPSRVHLHVGTITITGFSDGTMVEVERDEAAFTKKTGAQGDTARVLNRNRGGKFKFNLLQGAPCNALLAALARADEEDGTGVVPVQLTDMNGLTIISSTISWIEKMPKTDFSDDENGREWTIDCAELDYDGYGSTSTAG